MKVLVGSWVMSGSLLNLSWLHRPPKVLGEACSSLQLLRRAQRMGSTAGRQEGAAYNAI